jgi:hypothetical protein
MDSPNDKEMGVKGDNHVVDPINYDDHNRRGSTIGEKFRGSISVQHTQENAVEGQIFSMNDVDPALDAKMRLVNQVRPCLPSCGGDQDLTIRRLSMKSGGRISISRCFSLAALATWQTVWFCFSSPSLLVKQPLSSSHHSQEA